MSVVKLSHTNIDNPRELGGGGGGMWYGYGFHDKHAVCFWD